jgi:hypothetical protein
MFTAYIEEIDDVEAAISEILAQLNLQNRLLKNSVGILHCYYEFLESGMVRGLCARLPFDVVGATTMSLSAMGDMSLSVTVLTSGDIQFVTVISEELNFSFMEPEAILNSTWEKLKEYLPVAQGRNLLLYSCCARNWALGMKGIEEHAKAGEILGNAIPYQCVYSGGEIFPSFLEDCKIVNHLQNFSLIACVL